MEKVKVAIRARYGETDQGGKVYHSNYLVYFDVARTAFIRETGFSYDRIERELGVVMPVVEALVKHVKPVLYEEEIVVEARVTELKNATIRWDYRVMGSGGDSDLRATGYTVLAAVNRAGRPVRLPRVLTDKITAFPIRNSEFGIRNYEESAGGADG